MLNASSIVNPHCERPFIFERNVGSGIWIIAAAAVLDIPLAFNAPIKFGYIFCHPFLYAYAFYS